MIHPGYGFIIRSQTKIAAAEIAGRIDIDTLTHVTGLHGAFQLGHETIRHDHLRLHILGHMAVAIDGVITGICTPQ